MPAAAERPTGPLIEDLLDRPHAYGFFQLVRLLEEHAGAPDDDAGPADPSREPVRFRAEASLRFAPSDVVSVERVRGEDGGPDRFRVTVSFLGVYGTSAPTPQYVSEMICQADPGDEGLRDFLDLFNDRLVRLYVRAWRKYRPHLRRDPRWFAERVAALLGHPLADLKALAGPEGHRLLGYVGLIGQHPRGAEGLRRVLRHRFGGVPVEVEQHVPDAQAIPGGQRCRLGRAATRLGEDVSLGERVRDLSGKFRVVLGPLRYAAFERVLPGGADHGTLRDWVRLYAPESLTFDFVAVLAGEDVPALRLAGSGERRLGLDSWLLAEHANRDRRVRFDPRPGGPRNEGGAS
jgi:type VI secretion system protein ImpH